MSLCKSRIPVREIPLGKPPEIPRIHLSLRKPRNWRISLTTSSSSASIAVPDITLSDERGRILIDTSAPKTSSQNGSSRTPKSPKKATNIPIIIKNKSVGKNANVSVENKKKRSNFHKASRSRIDGNSLEKSSTDRDRTDYDGTCNKGDSGDSFPEVRERPPFARGASEIIRVKSSSTCKTKNEPGTGVRRSKRRFVSSKHSGMGSNVSRHSGSGLSGRRTQSSGNLCNGAKILAPSVNKLFGSCGGRGVSNRDRNKFCGSLPNNLDDKEIQSGERTPESLYSVNNNYGDVYVHPEEDNSVELVFLKIGSAYHRHELSGGDQGYGSERSPEEEVPPPLHTSEPPSRQYSGIPRSNLSFITKDNTFEARLEKGSRGLGLSVTGGTDTSEKFPGLIRIKRMFPNQPAWECKMLQIGDVLLAANGIPLSGLTNNEALEVLRTTPNEVILNVCRPPEDIFLMPLPISGEPPPPPKRDPGHFISSSQLNAPTMLPLPEITAEPYEFEIVLKKVGGSLGFILRKEDGSVLGHCVRALVREPALSDGRIRPGDKIVTVNGVDISPMSHEEAVMYLRQCGEEVKLRLYRDPAQTPVSALSPTESCKTFRPKPALRKEAMDMLCDLAVKKLSPSDSSSSSGRSRLRGTSPSASPRRRILKKTPSDEKPERPSFLDLCAEGIKNNYPDTGDDDDTDSIITVISTSDLAQAAVESAVRAGPSTGVCNLPEILIEPASMPPMTNGTVFSYKNPAYQTAHPTVHLQTEAAPERHSDQNIPDKVFAEGGGSQGLLKWKGVLFTPEDGDKKKHSKPGDDEEILTIELCRGWNSRLGFSLQSRGSGTCVSAIYANSVAARDGRLRLGDELIMINDETTEGMSTADLIDLLRRIRGAIEITVKRKKQTKS